MRLSYGSETPASAGVARGELPTIRQRQSAIFEQAKSPNGIFRTLTQAFGLSMGLVLCAAGCSGPVGDEGLSGGESNFGSDAGLDQGPSDAGDTTCDRKRKIFVCGELASTDEPLFLEDGEACYSESGENQVTCSPSIGGALWAAGGVECNASDEDEATCRTGWLCSDDRIELDSKADVSTYKCPDGIPFVDFPRYSCRGGNRGGEGEVLGVLQRSLCDFPGDVIECVDSEREDGEGPEKLDSFTCLDLWVCTADDGQRGTSFEEDGREAAEAAACADKDEGVGVECRSSFGDRGEGPYWSEC